MTELKFLSLNHERGREARLLLATPSGRVREVEMSERQLVALLKQVADAVSLRLVQP